MISAMPSGNCSTSSTAPLVSFFSNDQKAAPMAKMPITR
jgi:hypothetical protein